MDFIKQKLFIKAVKDNKISLVKAMIDDPDIKPEGHYNHIAKIAFHLGHFDILKILINHRSFTENCILSTFGFIINQCYINKDLAAMQYFINETKIIKHLDKHFVVEINENIKKLIKENIDNF